MPPGTLAAIFVRPYHLRDRQAVRAIACDTADRGEPVERFFPDRELFADLLTRYYTDDEPESLWVAEADGCVIGYLTGCLDTRRYWRLMRRRIIPAALWHGICRGVLGSRRTWWMLLAGAKTLAIGGIRYPEAPGGHPAHLHLNLRREFRSQRVGQQLLERFLNQARAVGVPGVHASVREDNEAARRFFERMGFTVLGRHPVVRPTPAGEQRGETIVYGRSW